MYKQLMTWQIVRRQLQNPDFHDCLPSLGQIIKDGPKNSQVWSLQVAYSKMTNFPNTVSEEKSHKSTAISRQYAVIMDRLRKVDNFNHLKQIQVKT